MFRFTLSTLGAFTLLLGASGCTERSTANAPGGGPRHHTTYKMPENAHMLAIIIDLSPSFAEQIDHEQGAFTWMLRVIDEYKRNLPAGEGRLLIAQVSGGGASPLVWEGNPSNLRKSFPDADTFKEFMISQSQSAGGTPLYAGLGDTLDFVLRHPTVRSGQSSVDLIVISDMVDNLDTNGSQEQRLVKLLTQFAAQGNGIGMYYVDPSVTAHFTEVLAKAGYPDVYFTAMIDRFPETPEFQ